MVSVALVLSKTQMDLTRDKYSIMSKFRNGSIDKKRVRSVHLIAYLKRNISSGAKTNKKSGPFSVRLMNMIQIGIISGL